MSWILYVLLVLAVAGDILLAVVLTKVMHKNDEPQQKIDTADDFVRAVTPVLQSETDLLAEQLRAMQGESARTTTATLRDFSAVLAENQRQNAAASTARASPRLEGFPLIASSAISAVFMLLTACSSAERFAF